MPESPRPLFPSPAGALPPAGAAISGGLGPPADAVSSNAAGPPVAAAPPLGPPMHAFAAQVATADPATVRAVLQPLRDAFARHRAATEGAAGSYADVVADAPRLARAVENLVADHAGIEAAMAHLATAAAGETSADALRTESDEVLAGLRRHAQRDCDLVHEAYATDIGGER